MEIPSLRFVAIVILQRESDNAEAARQYASMGPVAIPRVPYYQITIDPARLSPSKEFIRLGFWSDQQGNGDELTGWFDLAEIEIIEVLARADENGELRSVTQPAQGATEKAA
jgi:hypothetical protein